MESANRRFTSDEVTSIIRRALEGRGSHDDVSMEELEDIASKSGVTLTRLREAIEEQETLGELDRAKQRVRDSARKEFFEHFRAYCIVNGGIFVINLMTGFDYPWFLWPMVGWGIGLAFHASEALFPNEKSIEVRAQRSLRKEARNRAKRAYDKELNRGRRPDPYAPASERDL